MVFRSFLVLLFIAVLGATYALDFYIAAPSTLRLNSNETIAVAFDGNHWTVVNVLIQDYPGKVKNIWQISTVVHPGQPQIFTLHLNPSDFPPHFFNALGSSKFVSLNVRSGTFRKEINIPISTESGYLFIQTDKPIYTPKHTARMRIVPLNEASLPSDEVFKLQIRNPNDNVVEEKVFDSKNEQTKKAFVSHSYKFPSYPLLGVWSVTVLYGYEFQQNSTVRFELQEYVLPTFSVELKTPNVIFPWTEAINISVVSKYSYGKKVQGNVTFRLGVQMKQSLDNSFYPPGDKLEPTIFCVTEPKELVNGASELTLDIDEIRNHTYIPWFPLLAGSRLVVEATVLEYGTGNKEVAIDTKVHFATSPFIISFKKCLRDFKPGHVSVFQANIYYQDGRPASGIPTTIKASGNYHQLNIVQSTAISDEDGKVAFEVQPELHHIILSATIRTNDPRYHGSQAIETFKQRKFESPDNAYIALARSTGQRLQPGDVFKKMIHFKPEIIQDIYYMVIVRGKILLVNKLPFGQFITRSVEFEITHEMVPSFRVLVFAHFHNKLLADSLKIEVERVCNPKAQVSVTPEYNVKEPGSPGKFIIRGTNGTLVGLLGVDEAVYALSNKDLLTKSKVFDKLEKHDLGCGPGGGWNVNTVLGNAGITIVTNKHTPSSENTCVGIKRRKREAHLDIANNFTGVDRMCCSLGKKIDYYNQDCQKRTDNVVEILNGQYENCSRAFLDCCIFVYGYRTVEVSNLKLSADISPSDLTLLTDISPSVRSLAVADSIPRFIDSDFITLEEEYIFEEDLAVRSDFRETWLFEDILIWENNTEQFFANLPHSITTWVIQTVSVSPTHGICVAEPQKLVSFKKIFLHLNLPYSVVRNEQVEIQATVFNYGYKRISAVMYMYGVGDLCTGAQPGEKSKRKRLRIDAESSASTSFHVIPLKAGDIPIKVVVLTSEGSDAIEKQLNVVYEGVLKEISIPIKLDPTNQQKRARRQVNNELYSDRIDSDQNLQVTTIQLNAPKGFVPGTASCSITALGDQFGTVIDTCINNPESLLQLPTGCGEQNMMRLAPTLYTVRYLKVTGKLTPEMEEKGYNFIRIGYDNQLKFRKADGSYACFPYMPTSGWLTAFVMKVFCQAKELVHIDPNVLCSGLRWLIKNQQPDGSYIEQNPMYAVDLMGGVQGITPMTAFTLIALQECKCDEENLPLAKARAVMYLETHLTDVNTPLATAIVAYALALSGSLLKQAANDKLLSMMHTDEGTNMMYWITPNAAQDIQTAGYGLLTQLLFNDLDRSSAIVNWLNRQQLQSGSFKSTQDTVIALQALSEYAIKARPPPINLVANISSSSSRNFNHVLTFKEDNALILQAIKVDGIGDTLSIRTSGNGMGSLAVKLRYNLIVPPEEISKFHVTVNVSDANIKKQGQIVLPDSQNEMLDPSIRSTRSLTRSTSMNFGRLRIKRDNQEREKQALKISICVRYLARIDAGMSIVDVGIFSGFEPVLEDLQTLIDDPNHLIQKYEKSRRGVIFYLEKVPSDRNYCFSFHVVQEYKVGNTQMSVIKVYDYYNPDASSTKFYSPASYTNILQICEGGICQCAESFCPARNPFSSIYAKAIAEESRQKLKEEVCLKYDYVWKGKLFEEIKKEGGFLNISFMIDKVIKEGTEKRYQVERKVRNLLVRDNCDQTSPVQLDTTYLILGRDGLQYKNYSGDAWYRYMLDKNSAVFVWNEYPESEDEELHPDLKFVMDDLLQKGCEH